MGCSLSRLENQEAVQLCKDRKHFIKQALDHRTLFSSSHLAYIQSLKRVSAALRDYIDRDEPREFSLDSFISPNPNFRANYLKSGGNGAVLVEERPPSPEIVRIQDCSPNVALSFPQTSQWDDFWNPFSSLDYYGYLTKSSLDQTAMNDDARGLPQVQEKEEISGLEDEIKQQEISNNTNAAQDQEQSKDEANCTGEEVSVESKEKEDDKTEETPVFTVYTNRRPKSMGEIIKDLEGQFVIACDAAEEVLTLLESSKAQCSSTPNELTAVEMLNAVALLHSVSSRSSSSRFLMNFSGLRDAGYESSGGFSEDSCIFSDHQSTLDRLYVWEKKLYEQVKSAEKIRIAYEKKLKQLRNQDVKGEDSSRGGIRDLYSQLQVSIHSAEAISKKIIALRDEELQPQLFELVQGLARMWKVMAECHRSQKQALDEAKLLLLAETPSKSCDPQWLATSALRLETELKNWRASFEAWIASQRSYLGALSGWLLRCVNSGNDTPKQLFSQLISCSTFPLSGICGQWSRLLDAAEEIPVFDGLDLSEREEGKMDGVGIRVLCDGMSVAVSSLTEFAVSLGDGYEELVEQWKNAELRPITLDEHIISDATL